MVKNKSIRKQTGLGLIGWAISLPIILIIIVAVFYEGRKAFWDYRVYKMCEEDGGLKIYEKVIMRPPEYDLYINEFGNFTIPREDKSSFNMKVYSKEESKYIKKDHPKILRNRMVIIRKEDNEVLGERIIYSRIGGDIPTGISHSSHYRCPKKLENIYTAVVVQTKED